MRDYDFGNFLHELRTRQGLSQFQLGSLLGVTDKAVSKWENGSAKPQSKTLRKLSDVLGVTADELLAGKFNPTNEKGKGVFAMKRELWNAANISLLDIYKSSLPLEAMNRYYSEYAEFRDSDIIIYFDLLRQLKAKAEEIGEYVSASGLVGASFVGFVMGASDVNPLKPHYFCPKCKKFKFDNCVLCGWDLPEKQCECGESFIRDGLNIPFETLRAAISRSVRLNIIVSTDAKDIIKDEIRAYFEGNPIISVLRKDLPGFERIIIINDGSSEFKDGDTLPFEDYFDKFRDYPTITILVNEDLKKLKLLEIETGVSHKTINFASSEVLTAFNCGNTDGISEFQADFFKKVFSVAPPTSFYDLIQALGLAHGTDVWINNAKKLINNGKKISDIIAYRDDVFDYVNAKLQKNNISNTGLAYKIMDDVRKGLYSRNGIPSATIHQLEGLGAEEWFIDSISKIKYLFPKAHGGMYAKSALIMMWYKINYPEAFKKQMLKKED